MYLPKGFNAGEAAEIAALVSCAYEQFAAFEEDLPWKLPAKYRLVGLLTYLYETRNPLDKGSDKLESRVKKGLLQKSEVEVPVGFVARDRNRVFVIFRGTKTTKEWITNFNTKLKPCFAPEYGNVHEGFHATYLSLRDNLLETLKKADVNKLFIGGHSLGGAFGTLALLDIELSLGKKARALYTFGSPRVGDRVFAQKFSASFGSRSFRVVNTSDIVPAIPLPIQLAGFVGGYFSHVDTPVDFNVQADDVELNHSMKTYAAAVEPAAGKGLFSFIARLRGS